MRKTVRVVAEIQADIMKETSIQIVARSE